MEFAHEVIKEADQYNGFNLVLTDVNSKSMVYVSNRPKAVHNSVQVVLPGIHVLSNAQLDSPWFKVRKHFSLMITIHFSRSILKSDPDMQTLMLKKTFTLQFLNKNLNLHPCFYVWLHKASVCPVCVIMVHKISTGCARLLLVLFVFDGP